MRCACKPKELQAESKTGFVRNSGTQVSSFLRFLWILAKNRKFIALTYSFWGPAPLGGSVGNKECSGVWKPRATGFGSGSVFQSCWLKEKERATNHIIINIINGCRWSFLWKLCPVPLTNTTSCSKFLLFKRPRSGDWLERERKGYFRAWVSMGELDFTRK